MNRVQKKFICEAMDNESDLTQWEIEFISSLADKPDEYELSEKQNKILNRIQRKIT